LKKFCLYSQLEQLLQKLFITNKNCVAERFLDSNSLR
jgi:hypothetical protein